MHNFVKFFSCLIIFFLTVKTFGEESFIDVTTDLETTLEEEADGKVPQDRELFGLSGLGAGRGRFAPSGYLATQTIPQVSSMLTNALAAESVLEGVVPVATQVQEAIPIYSRRGRRGGLGAYGYSSPLITNTYSTPALTGNSAITATNALATNALTTNALNTNALTTNALATNALATNALATAAYELAAAPPTVPLVATVPATANTVAVASNSVPFAASTVPFAASTVPFAANSVPVGNVLYSAAEQQQFNDFQRFNDMQNFYNYGQFQNYLRQQPYINNGLQPNNYQQFASPNLAPQMQSFQQLNSNLDDLQSLRDIQNFQRLQDLQGYKQYQDLQRFQGQSPNIRSTYNGYNYDVDC